MTNERLTYLLKRYADKNLSLDERAELKQLLDTVTAKELPDEVVHALMQDVSRPEVIEYEPGISEILQPVFAIDKSEPHNRRVFYMGRGFFKYAAAILLILTGVGVYIGMFHDSKPGTKVVDTAPPSVPARDILPGSDRAILTLSNGQQVELNNAASETIKDGALSIENNQGQLSYPPLAEVARSAGGGLNTMTTPKGGQYKLTLADGTNVWLNAASSITYPTAFTGKTREVSVTGEAYFEVSKNKEKPFIVTVASSYPPLAGVAPKAPEVDRERSERTRTYRIEVLGTSFNVNSYPDETSKTSLLEGSIKVNNNILQPGQAFTSGKIVKTNLKQDLAWKNGVFDFNNATVQQAMRQLARWYDVEIVYDEPVNEVFIGEIGRNLTLSQVLKTIEGAGVHFRLEGKVLHVFK